VLLSPLFNIPTAGLNLTPARPAGERMPVRGVPPSGQLPWLSSQDAASLREGYLYWMGPGAVRGQVAEFQARVRDAEVPDRPPGSSPLLTSST
jgi:hypothetical protein